MTLDLGPLFIYLFLNNSVDQNYCIKSLQITLSIAGHPSALVVLVEEELVVIDLQTDGWPVIQTPYLVPLHSSAITCSHHVSAIPLKLWERITAAGDLQKTHYSKKVHQKYFKTVAKSQLSEKRYKDSYLL